MTVLRVTFFALGLLAVPAVAQAAPVLMISIDGLRPRDVLEADAHGFKAPFLKSLIADGTYASGVKNALPTVTYPNHTTLITGVWPARHGIANNPTFDPLQKNMGGWYWYTQDIKVGTLWDAVHNSGGKVASLSWPVIPLLEKRTGLDFAQTDGEEVEKDVGRARFAAALIAAKHPMLTTVHLRGLDHIEHGFGPGSAEAKDALQTLDKAVGDLVADARKAEPGLVVAIVSDHGFAPVDHSVNLIAPFIQAGLITLDKNGKVSIWQAEPWGGASAAVVLANPDDAALKAKVSALLNDLAAKPELGIDHVADGSEVAKLGGTPMASFWIDFKPGYQMGTDPAASPVGPSPVKGTHGYFPNHPEMRATFILAGPGIGKHGSLGEIDMRDIAPTLAKVMKVQLPDADGKPLF